MDERTENRIEGWDSKPLTGGFAELHELADGGFSGVARARGTTLCMLNGRVVGVFGGSIDDFADEQTTAYKAPHPSLPLLFSMKEYGGAQQAKYYTNDTPISEAHQQLSDAQFTGYIELSENVLSGDYYVVYYGGRSMSCAFVGNSERLETGDEAFQLADDEVGIYEVMSVDIEVTDIPEPTTAAGGGGQPTDAQGTDGGTDTADAGGGAGAESPQEPDRGPTSDPQPDPDPEPTAEPGGSEPVERDASGSDPGAADPDQGGADEPGPRTDTGADAGADPTVEQGASSQGQADPDRGSVEDAGPTGGARDDDGRADPDANDEASAAAGGDTEPAGAAGSADARAEPAGAGDPATDSRSDSAADAGQAEQTGGGRRTDAAVDRAVEAAAGPQGTTTSGAATSSDGVPKGQAALGDLRPIPSLSPDHTAVAEPGEERGAESDDHGRSGAAAGSGSTASTGTNAGTSGQSTPGRSGSTDGTRTGSTDAARSDAGGTAGTDVTERATQEVDVNVDSEADPEPVPQDAGAPELRQKLRAREERIEELETAITDLRVQRDGLTDDRDRLASEVERLESEVDDLQAEVERLQSRLKDGTEGKQRLSVADALGGTNLFIRYDSKSGGTLNKAHEGAVAREEVNNNLRLEHHTQFDADEVVVEDEPFDDFLRGTIYRRFVEWVVRDLLYEIQDTGHVKALADLYDAIPRIDRAELIGDVSVQYTEDGEEYREQRSFDVVLRDRMGNPLIVANLNDSRNPADSDMMETVIHNGIDVKGSNASLASAMMVTASFFKPGALETADEATGGGLLSRESKKSFVKTNRKEGYHLVLVESREDDFHVNVPEL